MIRMRNFLLFAHPRLKSATTASHAVGQNPTVTAPSRSSLLKSTAEARGGTSKWGTLSYDCYN